MANSCTPASQATRCSWSTHVCRPSLANDNCAGMAVLAHLAQWIISTQNRYSYRFVLAPETIGTLAWLAG